MASLEGGYVRILYVFPHPDDESFDPLLTDLCAGL